MSGNGADIGRVIAMLGELMRTQHQQGRELGEVASRLSDVTARLNDVAAGLTDLRQAVGHYHASVLGHGILITELDARVRRLEEHLKLPPMAA